MFIQYSNGNGVIMLSYNEIGDYNIYSYLWYAKMAHILS